VAPSVFRHILHIFCKTAFITFPTTTIIMSQLAFSSSIYDHSVSPSEYNTLLAKVQGMAAIVSESQLRPNGPVNVKQALRNLLGGPAAATNFNGEDGRLWDQLYAIIRSRLPEDVRAILDHPVVIKDGWFIDFGDWPATCVALSDAIPQMVAEGTVEPATTTTTDATTTTPARTTTTRIRGPPKRSLLIDDVLRRALVETAAALRIYADYMLRGEAAASESPVRPTGRPAAEEMCAAPFGTWPWFTLQLPFPFAYTRASPLFLVS
jgi:hypothetical protein